VRDLKIIRTQQELIQAYLNKCRATQTHLVGLNTSERPSECHIYHECSKPLPEPWVSDVFRDAYWFEAIANFCQVELDETFRNSITQSHGDEVIGLIF
jgi:hypothetical protein